ncbi:MAG: hypothetical protein MUP71_09425 [Candidatus Aminicenantes bacterium]|nr:hypothetical protein [Candidatus Aminicenantes bacterium]
MTISEIIAKDKCYTQDEIEQLQAEVEFFLNKKEPSQAEILSQRSNLFVSPAPFKMLFRSKERNENISQILQQLVAFLIHIPTTSEGENQALGPLDKFMECVLFEVDLLQADDIGNAVFNSVNQMGSLNGDNVWDYMGRIIEKNRELNELLITGTSDAASNFITLCLVLEELCLFWFEVKQEDMRRIRLSDIFTFKLARILQDRCRQT